MRLHVRKYGSKHLVGMAAARADGCDSKLGELPPIELADLRGSDVMLLSQSLEEPADNLALRLQRAAIR